MSHRPAERLRQRDPARRAAYDVLHEVGTSEAYANLLVRSVFADYRLTSRDAAFATELVMGTLRHRGTLDAVLATCVTRPLGKLDPRVLDALRLAAYQSLYLDTAPHAVVNTSVELVAEVCGPAPKGLVNAVARKVTARSREQWLAEVTQGLAAPAALAVQTSHPEWIVASLRDALRGDDDELAELLACHNSPPPVTLAAHPPYSTTDELIDAAEGAATGQWSPYAVRLSHGRPGDLAAVRQHRAGVQDEGSQLVALAVAKAPLGGRDQRWLDLCAGPGGKTAMLATVAESPGALVVAAELHHARARLTARATSRMAACAGVVQTDGRAGPWRAGTFDRVLLDAPCTGLGALRRRPESRWRRTPGDVSTLVTLQRDLLNAALDAVRPGGLVGYVTCSPHVAETDIVVDDVLTDRADVVEVDARAGLPEAVSATLPDEPRVRLWPHRHDTDGMFLALLQRT